MLAYKLVRIKKGKLYSLFINNKIELPLNKWLTAECHLTKGFAKRVGWHCCENPVAPHLKLVLSNGEKRIWIECEIKNYFIYNRPEAQGGKWFIANNIKLLRIV